MHRHRPLIALTLLLVLSGPVALCLCLAAAAEETAPAPAPESPDKEGAPAAVPENAASDEAVPADDKEDNLSTTQDQVSRRFRRFEETLVKLNEIMRKTDPERAELLIRALGRSKEDRIAQQMHGLVDLLKNAQLGEATDRQEELVGQLHTLLDLLLSEDRAKELAAEKERLKNYIKELNKIIAQEKDLRAATERGEPADGLAGRQKKVSEKAADLGKTIDKDDAKKRADAKRDGEDKPEEDKPGEAKPGDAKPSESKPGEAKPAESKPGESKPSESKPGESKPGESKPGEAKPAESKPSESKPGESKPGESKPGESKPGESKPGESKPGESKPGESKPGESKPGESKPGESKPGESKPGESKPGDSKPQDQQSTPGRENIEKAKQEMENAIDKLKKPDHHEASDHQDESIRELAKAREKFEEILRQLREEEREKMLAQLEARFQRMLTLQLIVLDGTIKLNKTPPAERQSRHHSTSVQLSHQEEEIALEATKAITLLREEGTAVAFPEAVEQMRDDMRIVVANLERTEVGDLTQAIEKDIVDALQEMIEALQKEMEKNDQKQPPGKPQEGPPQDPALVDQLAELKMLRALQLRVNRRTKTLGRDVQGEQAKTPDIVGQLQNLADRQARIQQATYDLATGKNK